MVERKLQDRVIQKYLETIWCIASSQYVKWFVVGYTANASKIRLGQYRNVGIDYMVILADRLTQNQAHQLEERLQAECKKGAAYGPPYRRKYHPDFRELSYRRSAGQGSPDPLNKIHSVYMAWAHPDDK